MDQQNPFFDNPIEATPVPTSVSQTQAGLIGNAGMHASLPAADVAMPFTNQTETATLNAASTAALNSFGTASNEVTQSPTITNSPETPVVNLSAASVDDPDYKRLTVQPLNFDLRKPFSTGEVPFDPNLPVIIYPSASRSGTQESINNAPNLNIKPGDAKLDRYATAIREGQNQIPMDNDQDEVRGREGVMFMQSVEVDGQELAGYVPAFKMREGRKYSGEAARNLVRNSLKLGTLFTTPLWHSGFWVTIRSPSESDMLELHRQLTQDKTILGRATYGLLFSTLTSYTAKTMTDFIVEHMHSTSLKVADDDNVLNYIKAQDYQLLLWGLTCATWPNGYQFQRPCVTDVEKCQHITTERINLSRLLWEDTTSLTTKQKLHMTNRQKQSVTVEQVKAYCDDFLRGRNSQIKLNDQLSMVLKMPTLPEYIDVGYKWISMLEEQYGRAMGMNEDKRDNYLINHARAQAMRQFGHFVHSITVEGHEIDDTDDIAAILDDLSAEDDIRTKFFEAVQAYQNDSIVAFPAIPNYKCPSCGGLQNATGQPGQKHELIALDIAQTFFPLLMQKLSFIQGR